MITSTRILLTENQNPHHNLALEEALMRQLPPGQAILYLWQNRHTVVIGAGQNAWRECHTTLLAEEKGTLARRSSGGGAVYHDLGNLNFSFIVPPEDYDVARQSDVVLAAVQSLGIYAERSGRNDLTADGRKFSGNAFRMLKNSALQHGTLLIDSDMDMVKRYLNVSKDKLKAKGVQSVPARVVNLNTLGDVTVERMLEAMISAFCRLYGASSVEMADDSAFLELPDLMKKYESWDWNFGASPEGGTSAETRFPWGGVQIIADVKNGAAERVCVYTDAMDETLKERLEQVLCGCVWRGDALGAAAQSIGEAEIAGWLSTIR